MNSFIREFQIIAGGALGEIKRIAEKCKQIDWKVVSKILSKFLVKRWIQQEFEEIWTRPAFV
jgi:hypothetical protein